MIFNLVIDEKIESRQTGKGYNVHDHKVEPSDVDADVSRIGSQRGLHHHSPVVRVLRVEASVPSHFPKSGNVIQKREDPERDDVTTSSSEGANGSGLERQTDRDVSLDTDAQRQVDAAGLGDHSDRIDDGRDERKDIVKVEFEEPLLRVRVDSWKAKHQDAGQEQDGVVTGLNLIII